jgi:branched-chain amino acid transport system permease protein
VGQTIWSGLTTGAIFALVASGFTLTMIPTGVFNFAQGALVIGGTFLAYTWMEHLGVGLVPALLLNILVGIGLGLMCELVTIRPLRWTRAVGGGPSELITTVGMATALVGAYGLIWGYDPLKVPFDGPTGAISLFGVRAQPVEAILVGVAIAVAVALAWAFHYTRIGHACTAVAEDRDAAMLRGINVNLLSLGAFGASGALAAGAAIFIGPVTLAVPTLANTLTLGGFVALAVGGERSFIGGLLGGFGVGLVQALSTRYIGSDTTQIAVLAVLMATLMVRPEGLGGAVAVRDV